MLEGLICLQDEDDIAAWNQRDLRPDDALLPGLDHIANFLNSLDTEGMTAKQVRSAIYSECIEPGCKSHLAAALNERNPKP